MAAKLRPPLWPGPPCPRRPWPGGRGRLSVRTTVQVPGQPQARELPRPQHTPHARRQSPAAPRCPVPYCHRLPTPLAPPDTADGQARGARAGWGRLPFSGPEPRPARSPHKGSVGPRRLPHVCGFPAAGGTLPRLPAYPQPGPVVHSTGRERGLGVQLRTASCQYVTAAGHSGTVRPLAVNKTLPRAGGPGPGAARPQKEAMGTEARGAASPGGGVPWGGRLLGAHLTR